MLGPPPLELCWKGANSAEADTVTLGSVETATAPLLGGAGVCAHAPEYTKSSPFPEPVNLRNFEVLGELSDAWDIDSIEAGQRGHIAGEEEDHEERADGGLDFYSPSVETAIKGLDEPCVRFNIVERGGSRSGVLAIAYQMNGVNRPLASAPRNMDQG